MSLSKPKQIYSNVSKSNYANAVQHGGIRIGGFKYRYHPEDDTLRLIL